MLSKKRVWELLEAGKPTDRFDQWFDNSLLALIFLNVAALVLESVEPIRLAYAPWFDSFETFSVAVFTVEYIGRIWACTVDPRFKGALIGRLRIATSPLAVMDVLAIAPAYLPMLGVDLLALRIFRLFRIAKIGRYYSSLQLITRVVTNKREELVLTTVLMCMLLVISASLLYYAERVEQPDKYNSIPASMWWSVATLTTVGYGDIFPVTIPGKIWASLIAVVGIGMFALPTGIIGAGFVEEISHSRGGKACPHCGELID
jgi:voltage-gated potassium channel